MLKRLLLSVFAISSLMFVSCAKQVHFATPSDGQTFQVGSNGGQQQAYQQLLVQIDDTNRYQDVTIQQVGVEKLPAGLLSCSGGQGSMISCFIGTPQNMGTSQAYAIQYKLFVGEMLMDTRLVYIQVGQPMTPTPH